MSFCFGWFGFACFGVCCALWCLAVYYLLVIDCDKLVTFFDLCITMGYLVLVFVVWLWFCKLGLYWCFGLGFWVVWVCVLGFGWGFGVNLS